MLFMRHISELYGLLSDEKGKCCCLRRRRAVRLCSCFNGGRIERSQDFCQRTKLLTKWQEKSLKK